MSVGAAGCASGCGRVCQWVWSGVPVGVVGCASGRGGGGTGLSQLSEAIGTGSACAGSTWCVAHLVMHAVQAWECLCVAQSPLCSSHRFRCFAAVPWEPVRTVKLLHLVV